MRLLLVVVAVFAAVTATASTVQAEYVKRGSITPIVPHKPLSHARLHENRRIAEPPVQAAHRNGPVRLAKPLLQRILSHSFKEGVSSAFAGIFHTVSLLWLKTIIHYQYKNGVTFSEAAKLLYKEGGILRFYQGITFALIQSPLSRFGAVAANEAMLLLPGVIPVLQRLPPSVNTAIGSLIYSGWRMLLMPIDTSKTLLQVDGKAGSKYMFSQLARGNFAFLYQGTIASTLITFLVHYPWFVTFNLLHKLIPETDNLVEVILRAGFIGFLAAATSDVVANPVRIVKTIKQTCEGCTYQEAIEQVLLKDGYKGLFFRGLGTRLLNNCLQSVIFTVLWRMIRYYRSRGHQAQDVLQEVQPEVAPTTNTTVF